MDQHGREVRFVPLRKSLRTARWPPAQQPRHEVVAEFAADAELGTVVDVVPGNLRAEVLSTYNEMGPFLLGQNLPS